MELLNHTVTLCLVFSGTFRLFYKAATPFYIPTSSVRGLQFLYILANTRYFLTLLILVILVEVKWYLVVILISIFLIANNVEHLFLFLLSSIYLLWRNIHLDPLLIFKWAICFFFTELLEFFLICSIYKSLIRCITNKLYFTFYLNSFFHMHFSYCFSVLV